MSWTWEGTKAKRAMVEEGQRQLAEALEWYRVHAIRTGLADPHTCDATRAHIWAGRSEFLEGFSDVPRRGITTGGGLE